MELLADIQNLNLQEILSDELFLELLSDESEVERIRNELELIDRAKILGVKSKFESMLKAFKAEKKKFDKSQKIVPIKTELADGITHFTGSYEDLYCGSWICSDNGIYTITMFGESYACPHPILITKILSNAETGFVKVQIAFKVRGRWKEIFVDKETISSSSKIISLSNYGIMVNSENAKNLIRYFTDIESLNSDVIVEQISTSKLGWISDEFMPYGENIVFDNENNLKSVFDSVKESCGDRQKWYSIVMDIRKENKMETMIYIASSFASILVEPLNALPFVVSLYGTTGKGKTVALMLATSIWANPSEGQYMSDAKATATALEMRLSFLNSLPLMLDDMAQVKNQYDGDFSQLIYLWCAGKGKDRANRNLGLNAPTTWRNVIITNSEHSLITATMQGGAVNRIIDVEMSDGYIFENGNKIVEILKNNYGFAGREFVELIQSISQDDLKDLQKSFYEKIVERAKAKGVEKEEKQILPMSILLTADYLIEKHLFLDGCRLDFNKCVDLLKNKDEVSENTRAYEFLINEIQLNISKFISKDDDYTPLEIWGIIEENSKIAVINGNAFTRILEKGGFSEKSFLSWAAKNKLIETDSKGNYKKQKKIKGTNMRCVFVVMEEEFEEITQEQNQVVQEIFN